MHKRRILLLILTVHLILVSCSPGPEPTDVSSVEKASPTSAPAATATVAATPLPTAAPTREQPSPSPPATTVSFTCPGDLISQYQELAETFHRDNPDVEVRVIPRQEIVDTSGGWPEDAAYQMLTRVDTAVLQTPTWEDFQQGVLRDLQPLMEADPNFRPEGFYPAALEPFRWRGSTWAIPRSIDPMLIFYDKDAFDEAGVPYPQPGWTWEEFVDKARVLTVRREGEVARYGFADQWAVSSLGIVSGMSGASLVDRSGQSPEPVLNSPEVVEAAERYLDLALVEEAMFTGYESGEPRQVFELIDERRTAMWTEEASRGRQRGGDFRVGVVPFPKGEVSNNLTWAQGLVMSAGTDHPQESWRWLTFLSRQQPTAGDKTPSRRSIAQGMSYWEGLDHELRTACQYALEHPLTWWTYEEISGAFYHAIREALTGASVEETLSEAQQSAYEAVTTLVQSPSEPIEMIPLEAERSSQAEAIITFLPFGRRMSWEPVIEAFTSEHPDVAVEVVSLEGTHSFQDWAASADCFTWVGPIKSSPTGVLSPEPFIELEPDLTVDEFYAHSVAAFQWEGRLWALPGTASPQVTFYNKQLFDEAGVPYPQLDWTWDDFAAQADLLTSRDENQYGFLDQPFDSQDVAPLSLLFPVVVSRVGSPDAFPLPFDDPRVVDAVAWYFDMMPGTDLSLLSAEERGNLIEEGKVAMWTDLTRRADYYVPDLSYEVGMAPVPGGETRAAAVAYLGYFISEETQHPEASWEWVKFLSTSLVPQEYGGRGWGIPTFRPLVESTHFKEIVGSEEAPVYQESLEYDPISLPAILGGDSSATVQRRWEAFVQALVSVARGAEVEQALRDAETRIEREE